MWKSKTFSIVDNLMKLYGDTDKIIVDMVCDIRNLWLIEK